MNHILEHQQRIKDQIEKSLGLNDLEKGGEGSRGGKIIGHTKSGKPIYDSHDHPSHSNFSFDDHFDANKLHNKIITNGIKEKGYDRSKGTLEQNFSSRKEHQQKMDEINRHPPTDSDEQVKEKVLQHLKDDPSGDLTLLRGGVYGTERPKDLHPDREKQLKKVISSLHKEGKLEKTNYPTHRGTPQTYYSLKKSHIQERQSLIKSNISNSFNTSQKTFEDPTFVAEKEVFENKNYESEQYNTIQVNLEQQKNFAEKLKQSYK